MSAVVMEPETITCPKCEGSGTYYSTGGICLGPCYTCKGKKVVPAGTTAPPAPPLKGMNTKPLKVQCEEWIAAHPDLYAWLITNRKTNGFADKMLTAMFSYGRLTDNQFAAVEKIRLAKPVTVNIEPIVAAFAKAAIAGLKRPKVYLGDFQFKLAPPTGQNAGAIYVTRVTTIEDEGEYLGKIVGGVLRKVAACTSALEAAIVEVCADPMAAAVAYGKKTGRCSCCMKELTDPESVALGIGPVCAKKWGFK